MIQLEFVFHVFCDSEIGAIKRMFGLTFFRKCFDVFVVENAFMQTYILHERITMVNLTPAELPLVLQVPE